MKSGKSTDSLKYLGKSYRFFAEIRHASRPKKNPSGQSKSGEKIDLLEVAVIAQSV